MSEYFSSFDEIQNQRDLQRQQISKSFIVAEEDGLEKGNGGEGSRGGKIIGYTKSGKPVYKTNGYNKAYKDFTAQDHRHAAKLHREYAEERGGVAKSKHLQFAYEHEDESNNMSKS